MPKSTVSRRVARLEQDLGEELLQRLPRRVELTEVGLGLYDRTVDAVETLRRAAAEVHEAHDDLAGELRISIPHDLGLSQHMVRLFTDFRATHPRISLEIDLSERRVDLLEERFDFAFRAHLGPARLDGCTEGCPDWPGCRAGCSRRLPTSTARRRCESRRTSAITR